MAKLSCFMWAFALVIFQATHFKFGICSYSATARTKFQIPKNFGQNLTGEIDSVLKENNLINKAVLKEALSRSPIVYYETDLLLDEIEDIIQVIDLLNPLTPARSIPPKITLSLPYINQTDGRFLWPRISDIYYSLDKNISASNKTKILKSVASITLSFISSQHSDNSLFYYGSGLHDFQFVDYVKNFVSLYFGHLSIPVGIMWNQNMQTNYLVNREIPKADFSIFYIEFNLLYKYPMFLERLDVQINRILRDLPLNISLFINMKYITTQTGNSAWDINYFNSVRKAVAATIWDTNSSYKFVSNLYHNSNQLSNYIFLFWSDISNRDVILGNPLQNLSSEILTQNGSRAKLILPFIKVEEIKIKACDLKTQFTKWNSNYEAVILDERSWRSLARYKDDLEDSQVTCNETSLLHTQRETLKVSIQFTSGLASQWNHLENHMKRLIYSYPKISQLVLDTIIFYEEDLKKSLEIQQFITSAKSKYKIGCSMKFESINEALNNFTYYHNTFLENTFKTELEGYLCQPIFKLLDVMIWDGPQSENIREFEYLSTQLLSLYSNMFLTREIFQNTFPHIKVYIRFPSTVDKRILANLFKVPIIVSSDQILY